MHIQAAPITTIPQNHLLSPLYLHMQHTIIAPITKNTKSVHSSSMSAVFIPTLPTVVKPLLAPCKLDFLPP